MLPIGRDDGGDGFGEELDRSFGGFGPDPGLRGRPIELPDEPRLPGERRAARSAEPPRAVTWLLGPLILAAIAAGTLLVFRGPDEIFGAAFGVVLGFGFLWILVSVLFPSRADRTCPACGKTALRRMDPESTSGLACSDCDWFDESASSFYLAEEEGPMEDIVLRQRGRSGPTRRF